MKKYKYFKILNVCDVSSKKTYVQLCKIFFSGLLHTINPRDMFAQNSYLKEKYVL